MLLKAKTAFAKLVPVVLMVIPSLFPASTVNLFAGVGVPIPTLPLSSIRSLLAPVVLGNSTCPSENNRKGEKVAPGIFVTVYVVPFTLVLHSIPEVVFVIPMALPQILGPLNERAGAFVVLVFITTALALLAALFIVNTPAEFVPVVTASSAAPVPPALRIPTVGTGLAAEKFSNRPACPAFETPKTAIPVLLSPLTPKPDVDTPCTPIPLVVNP